MTFCPLWQINPMIDCCQSISNICQKYVLHRDWLIINLRKSLANSDDSVMSVLCSSKHGFLSGSFFFIRLFSTERVEDNFSKVLYID